jgi:hypothetical protein
MVLPIIRNRADGRRVVSDPNHNRHNRKGGADTAMFKNPKPRLTVFRKEPLLRAIATYGVSPVGLGIGFFFLVPVTLSIWAALAEPAKVAPDYVSYFDNISWSISMTFLFPFLFSLTLKYCQEIPNLFAFLLQKADESDGDHAAVNEFYVWLDRRFNSYSVSGVALAISISLRAHAPCGRACRSRTGG